MHDLTTPVPLTQTEADRIGAMLQTNFALDWFTDAEVHDLTVKLLPAAQADTEDRPTLSHKEAMTDAVTELGNGRPAEALAILLAALDNR